MNTMINYSERLRPHTPDQDSGSDTGMHNEYL